MLIRVTPIPPHVTLEAKHNNQDIGLHILASISQFIKRTLLLFFPPINSQPMVINIQSAPQFA